MSHQKDKCPICNGPKDARAARCRACRWSGIARDRTPKGHPRQVPRPDYSGLDPQWVAEFRGFFMGEGHICIARRRAKNQKLWNYRPELRINLRGDDAAVCYDIQQHLGGHVYPYANCSSANSNPGVCWVISGVKVDAILELLEPALLPARKLPEVSLCREFIAWRNSFGCRLGDEGREVAKGFYQRLRALRQFSF